MQAWRTTQRSSAGIRLKRSAAGMNSDGLHELPVLVVHAQQQLEVPQLLDAGADRHDRLADEQQAVLLAGAIDARHPLHLAMPLGRAPLSIGLHAVAAGVLRRVAGDVRGAHDRRQRFRVRR